MDAIHVVEANIHQKCIEFDVKLVFVDTTENSTICHHHQISTIPELLYIDDCQSKFLLRNFDVFHVNAYLDAIRVYPAVHSASSEVQVFQKNFCSAQ
jgi:hypothetical protein